MPYNSPVNQAIAGLGQTIGQAGDRWSKERYTGAQLGMERERLGATLAEHAAQEPVRQVASLKAQEELKSRRTAGNLASFLGENNDPLNLQLAGKAFGQFGKLLGSKLETVGPGEIYMKRPDGSRMSEYDISKRIGGLVGVSGVMTDRKTLLQGKADPESVAELARLNAMPELQYRAEELSTRQQAMAAIKAEYPDADLTELKEHIKWAQDKYEDAVKESRTAKKTRTIQKGLQTVTEEWDGSQWNEIGRGPKFKPDSGETEQWENRIAGPNDPSGYPEGTVFQVGKGGKHQIRFKPPSGIAMTSAAVKMAIEQADMGGEPIYDAEGNIDPQLLYKAARKYMDAFNDLGSQGGAIRRPMPKKGDPLGIR